MAEPLVEVRGLRARRGGFSLEVADWRVEPGRVVGVVGANGAGKSTLLRLLPGLDLRDDGALRVLGRDPELEPEAVRLRVGWMADDLPLFDLRLDRLLRAVSGFYPTWDGALVQRLVADFGLDLGKRTTALSRGEGSRLRLVLALAIRPDLLVLDEPAAGLDLSGRRRLLEVVLGVAAEQGRSVLISSHQLSDVERVADDLLVLREGRVVAAGPTLEVLGEQPGLEDALLRWGCA